MTLALVLGMMTALQDEPEIPTPADLHIELKADVWFASFEGSGRLNEWFGTERDKEKDAPRFSFNGTGRLKQATAVPGGDLQFLWQKGTQYRGFGIQYLQAEWSESGTVDRPFVVEGTTVSPGSAFESRLLKRTASAHVVGGRSFTDGLLDTRLRIGCLFHREQFRMETPSGVLRDGAGGLNVDVGGRGELRPLPYLFLAGEASASIGLGTPEVRASISGGLTWNGLRIEGGYRHLWTGWDVDPIFRLSVGGPFVGGALRF
jgi:hypothetical protein